MIKTAQFKKALRKHFAPKMKEAGYRKISELSWQRMGEGPWVFCIQIFPSRRGGACWIEAGVHLDFLPLSGGGEKPDPTQIETVLSFYRKRLTNTLNDRSDFIYGDEVEGLEILCDYLWWAVKDEAEAIFATCKEFPGDLTSVSVADLQAGKAYAPFALGHSMTEALAFARLHLFLGDQKKAKRFADYGLGLITGMRGSGLIPQFERIRQGELYL